MKILILGLNYSPELTGVGRYTSDMAKWLEDEGHDVYVVTSYPYYPRWRVEASYRAHWWSREQHARATVYRCPLWVPRAPTGWKRAVHLLSFAFSSAPVVLWQAWRLRPDVVLAIEPTMAATPAARLAATISGATAWLHVQDVELAAAEQLGLIAAGSTGMAKLLYGKLLKSFHHVTTLSESMRRSLETFGRPANTIELLPNWLDRSFRLSTDRTVIRARKGWKERDFVALYAGNIGKKQGVDQLLAVADSLADDPHVQLVICGVGADRTALAAAASHRPNIQMIETLPDLEFIELMEAVDVHLLPQRPGVSTFAVPSKILGMMATGRPIVAQADQDSEIRTMLDGRGLIVDPADSEGMANAIRSLKIDRQRSETLGNEAKTLVLNSFSRDQVLRQAFSRFMVRAQPELAAEPV